MSRLANAGGGLSQAQLPAALAAAGVMVLQSKTAAAGTALINGLQAILQWQAPNDGQLHVAAFAFAINVTALQTGGAVTVAWTSQGQAHSFQPAAGGLAVGSYYTNAGATSLLTVDPNTVVSISQSSAQTAGAAAVAAAIFGL